MTEQPETLDTPEKVREWVIDRVGMFEWEGESIFRELSERVKPELCGYAMVIMFAKAARD